MPVPMMPTAQWDIVRKMGPEELNAAAQGQYLNQGISPVFALARIEEEAALSAKFQAEEQKRMQEEQAKAQGLPPGSPILEQRLNARGVDVGGIPGADPSAGQQVPPDQMAQLQGGIGGPPQGGPPPQGMPPGGMPPMGMPPGGMPPGPPPMMAAGGGLIPGYHRGHLVDGVEHQDLFESLSPYEKVRNPRDWEGTYEEWVAARDAAIAREEDRSTRSDRAYEHYVENLGPGEEPMPQVTWEGMDASRGGGREVIAGSSKGFWERFGPGRYGNPGQERLRGIGSPEEYEHFRSSDTADALIKREPAWDEHPANPLFGEIGLGGVTQSEGEGTTSVGPPPEQVPPPPGDPQEVSQTDRNIFVNEYGDRLDADGNIIEGDASEELDPDLSEMFGAGQILEDPVDRYYQLGEEIYGIESVKDPLDQAIEDAELEALQRQLETAQEIGVEREILSDIDAEAADEYSNIQRRREELARLSVDSLQATLAQGEENAAEQRRLAMADQAQRVTMAEANEGQLTDYFERRKTQVDTQVGSLGAYNAEMIHRREQEGLDAIERLEADAKRAISRREREGETFAEASLYGHLADIIGGDPRERAGKFSKGIAGIGEIRGGVTDKVLEAQKAATTAVLAERADITTDVGERQDALFESIHNLQTGLMDAEKGKIDSIYNIQRDTMVGAENLTTNIMALQNRLQDTRETTDTQIIAIGKNLLASNRLDVTDRAALLSAIQNRKIQQIRDIASAQAGVDGHKLSVLDARLDRELGARRRLGEWYGKPLSTQIQGRYGVAASAAQGVDAQRLTNTVTMVNALSNLSSGEYLEDNRDHLIQQIERPDAIDPSTKRWNPQTGAKGVNYSDSKPNGVRYDQIEGGESRRVTDAARINDDYTQQLYRISRLATKMADALESDNPNVVMGQAVISGQYTGRNEQQVMSTYEDYKRRVQMGDTEAPNRLREWADQLEALIGASPGGN
jgi:hypothetical protein